MIVHPLNPEERRHVLDAVHKVLKHFEPKLFEVGASEQPGGIVAIDSHLDALVEIVRRSTADRIEPYLAQILDEICHTCPQAQPSAFCQLRYEGNCVLFRCATPILNAIADALEQLHDPEYLAVHADKVK